MAPPLGTRRRTLLAFAPALLALVLLPLWPAEPTYASAGLVPRTLGAAWAGLLGLRGAWAWWQGSAVLAGGRDDAAPFVSPWLALVVLGVALSPSTALALAVPAAAGLGVAAALAWWQGRRARGAKSPTVPAIRPPRPWRQALLDGAVLVAAALALAWAPLALGDAGALAAALLAGLAGVHGAVAALAAVNAAGLMDAAAVQAAIVAAMAGGALTAAAVAWGRSGGRESLRVLLRGFAAVAAAGVVAALL
jgi:uncharacterized membrane protein (DUF4010 family)